MNEADTRANLIDPALRAAGWGTGDAVIKREVHLAQERADVKAAREKGAAPPKKSRDYVDYVLEYRGHPLAAVEAKADTLGPTEGREQALRYAKKLKARFAFSTNGRGIHRWDLQTAEEGTVDRYPTPDELWAATFAEQNRWRDAFAEVPFESGGGRYQLRYYQRNAVDAVLEGIVAGRDRLLLTMATGTGKTPVAFQIVWKLFQARWNVPAWRGQSESTRRPRVLFLADRNILADQALTKFSAFEEDALARITPKQIKKEGGVPKNASIFFTLFQTFMGGGDADVYEWAGDEIRGPSPETPQNPDGPRNPVPPPLGGEVFEAEEDSPPKGGGTVGIPFYGEYAADFFDLVIIDECHRGGASDESSWRGILDHFAPAVQLGLTATPRRDVNADTYAYFGKAVYEYSLADGIEEGYLTPFRVKRIQTTLDEYTHTRDDRVLGGEVAEGDHFTEGDFQRRIVIAERETFRVDQLMGLLGPTDKAIVFCADQRHAALVRDLINQRKPVKDLQYCVRVTANDGAEGETFLRAFQDDEKTIPTVLTTSRKLSTGVDAPGVRFVVLMREVKSMVEFKQIIGRGTRLADGKGYFTVVDFTGAYEHFRDPEWDGPPKEPGEDRELPKKHVTDDSTDREPKKRPELIRIQLADGKARVLQAMHSTHFWGPDGKPMSAAEFLASLFGHLPDLFRNEAALFRLWSQPATRRQLLDDLAERGFPLEQLTVMAEAIDARESDLYDVLSYVAYATPPKTRAARAAAVRPLVLTDYDPAQQDFLDFVLNHYVQRGVTGLDDRDLPELLTVKYGGLHEATETLGPVPAIRDLFLAVQPRLYA